VITSGRWTSCSQAPEYRQPAIFGTLPSPFGGCTRPVLAHQAVSRTGQLETQAKATIKLIRQGSDVIACQTLRRSPRLRSRLLYSVPFPPPSVPAMLESKEEIERQRRLDVKRKGDAPKKNHQRSRSGNGRRRPFVLFVKDPLCPYYSIWHVLKVPGATNRHR